MCPKSSRKPNTWRHVAKLTGTYKVAKTGPTARDGNKNDFAFLAVTCWKAACWFRRLSWRGRCPSTTFSTAYEHLEAGLQALRIFPLADLLSS